MAYDKYTWNTGETITAPKLNHIEEGIKNNDNGITQLGESITNLNNTVAELGNKSKYELVDGGDYLEIIVGGDSP